MPVGRFLLLALALTVSVATSDLPSCSRAFSPQEWQKEEESYLLNIRELEQYLQPEPHFVSKVTLLATGKPSSFLELADTAVMRLVPLNRLYLSACALTAGLMLVFYLLRKKYESSQVPFLSLLLAKRVRVIKYLKFGIVLLLALAVLFSFKGINEGRRQEKALIHILCRISDIHKYMQKNNTFISNAQFQDYINGLSAKINGDNFVDLTGLQRKVRIAEYPQKIIEAIARALDAESYKGSVLQQLQDANKTLHFTSGYMVTTFRRFEGDCRQKALFLLSEVLKYSTIVDNLFDVISKDRLKDMQLTYLPQKATVFGKACFAVILVIVIATGVLILRKEQGQDKWVVHLDWLQFALSVVVILCFVTVIATTLFISFNFWVSQGGMELIRDPGYCYNAFSVFSNKIYGGVCRLLSPASNQTKYRLSSPFATDLCHGTYDEYDKIIRPYLSKNQSYFYDLMVSSAQEIRNETTRREIKGRMETHYAKAPLIPIMKDMEAHLAFSINLEDDIESQNINLTDFFENVWKLLMTFSTNSAFAIRQICRALSVILGLILLLIDLLNWLTTGSKLRDGAIIHEMESLQLSQV